MAKRSDLENVIMEEADKILDPGLELYIASDGSIVRKEPSSSRLIFFIRQRERDPDFYRWCRCCALPENDFLSRAVASLINANDRWRTMTGASPAVLENYKRVVQRTEWNPKMEAEAWGLVLDSAINNVWAY